MNNLDKAERLLEALTDEFDEKRYFLKIVNKIKKGDLRGAYEDYEYVFKTFQDKGFDEYYESIKPEEIYINKDKGVVVVKFEDGSISKAKCDKEDKFNPYAGVGIAIAKEALGMSNTEFKKLVQGATYLESKEPKKTTTTKKTKVEE